MCCLLCRKDNTKNEQNNSKVFSSDPAVRYRKPTLTSHADSRQHLAAIEAEHLQRVSTFHKESVNKENVADDVLYKALMSVYWIAKHEIPIRKLVSLLQLLEKVGVTEMKYFIHRSAGSVRELFLTLGQVIRKQLLEKVHIFDVMAIPSARSPGFKEYGEDHIKLLAEQFFTESETEESGEANVNTEKLKAEWGKFKFDLIDWKADLPRDTKEGKAATTSTT